jgi:predicted glycosyltransferase
MRLLFDVSHPALVHLFKHPIRAFADRGCRVRVASREKDITTRLLDAYDIDHVPVSTARGGPLSRARELLAREARLVRLAREFRPDVVVSQVDPAATHAARLAGARSVVFDDSEHEFLAAALTHPFADVICTPAAFGGEFGAAQRRYRGYHELAYLHPERFTPRPERLERAGVDPDERYFLLRFVSWSAHHDLGRGGFSPATKRRLVDRLDGYGTVYVSSEAPLPPELEPYRLSVPPERVHDLLAFADLYVGDSQTMATEAAVLGTPAIRSNDFVGADDMGNFRELERRYGLVRSIADEERALRQATEFARSPPADTWRRRRDRLLAETIDVASFVVETIEEVAAR